MKRRCAMTVALSCLLLAGCYSLNKAVDDDAKFVKIGGGRYRLSEASQTAMLHVGDKSVSGFNPQFRTRLVGEVPIRVVTAAKLETASLSEYESAVKLGIPVAHVAAGATLKQSDKQTAKLNVVNVIDLNDLARELEAPHNSANLELLRMYDWPRIVTALVLVEEFDSARTSGITGKIGADYLHSGTVSWDGSIGGSGSAERKEVLSKGTIHAYQLSRICWRQLEGRVKVVAIVPDSQGSANDCPTGSYDSAPQAVKSAAPVKS